MFNFRNLRSASTSSKYTFREERPEPTVLTPVQFAIKNWFDKKQYLGPTVRVARVSQGRIQMRQHEFQTFGSNYLLDIHAYFNVISGSAQFDSLECFTVDKSEKSPISYPSCPTYIEREDCSKYRINTQGIETWLVSKGYTGWWSKFAH